MQNDLLVDWMAPFPRGVMWLSKPMKTIPVIADVAKVDPVSEIWGMLTAWW